MVRPNRTNNLYDARGMIQATQDPLGAYTTYQFDGVGNTVLRVDARNWPTTYTVDTLNRVIGQLYVDGTRATFTFDADGRQVTMQDVTGITTFQYDAAGRQTGVVNGIGKVLAYSFDATGNRTVLVDPDSGRTTYTYDAQSRITGIVNPWNEATTLAYDALDREAQRVLGNGAAISRSYDQAGRETLISSPVAVYTASYDAVGNRKGVVELDGSRVTYSYDASYQLTREQRSGTQAIDANYAYDGLGNRLTKTDTTGITTCTYNASNALVTSMAPTGVVTTSSYDANGNLTLENAAGALTTYAWDSENRMLSVAAAGQTQTNMYSADGMRQSKATASGMVHYVRDGENVLVETDASLVSVAQHTDLPGMWGGKYAQRRSGASRFYVPDFQGNTRALLDAAAFVTDTLITDAWGVELLNSGATVNPFKAFGQWGYFRDTANRLDVRRRVLRVDQGRWMSRDPIGSGYTYCDGQPTYAYDPSGLRPKLDRLSCLGNGVPAFACIPKDQQSDIDQAVAQICSDAATGSRVILACAAKHLPKGSKMDPSCLSKWCSTGKDILCDSSQNCGHPRPNATRKQNCAPDCATPFLPVPFYCAWSGYDSNAAITICCFFNTDLYRACDPGNKELNRYACARPKRCIVAHELVHMCAGLRDDNATELAIPGFAKCVLDGLGMQTESCGWKETPTPKPHAM